MITLRRIDHDSDMRALTKALGRDIECRVSVDENGVAVLTASDGSVVAYMAKSDFDKLLARVKSRTIYRS